MTDASHTRFLTDPELAGLIVENAVEYAIFTMDRGGRITSWSPGAAAILGYGKAEALGMNVASLFTEPDRAAGVVDLELRTVMAKGRAEDSRWHIRKNGERFWANGVMMRFQNAEAPCLLKVLRDETPSKLAEEQRILLLNELNHRVKNTLTTVQSIAEQTMRAGRVPGEVRRTFTERLIALSEAHDVLLKESWAGADLQTVIEQAVAPHQDEAETRFRLDGPQVRLSPDQAVSISLIIHELTTNALKYGSLTVPGGRVTAFWNIAQDGDGRRYLTLLWQELDGPPVAPPTRRGFGTRLIERSFAGESGGKALLEYRPEGVRCVIDVELSSAKEIPILDLKS